MFDTIVLSGGRFALWGGFDTLSGFDGGGVSVGVVELFCVVNMLSNFIS